MEGPGNSQTAFSGQLVNGQNLSPFVLKEDLPSGDQSWLE